MTGWEWWVGSYADVEYEGAYGWGGVTTRNHAIALGLRETRPGERFYIVEARSSQASQHEDADVIPFLRQRKKELVEHTKIAVAS